MPTNLHDNGDYPIEEMKSPWIPFETLWKEELSFLPEAPLDWKDREVFKKFAQRVYDLLKENDGLQEFANMAYNDGYDDGKFHMGNDIKEELEKLEKESGGSELLDRVKDIVDFV